MKPFNAIASSIICGTCLLATKGVEAKPFIYVDSYSYDGTADKCVENAESELKKLEFENFVIDNSLKNKRKLSVAGYHKDEYIAVEIHCDQKIGITSLGVSGLDPDLTYEMYGKLHKASW